ncbi:hypothetical protein BJ508DRAFT_316202, partial [Ascobolus immersus RN42]
LVSFNLIFFSTYKRLPHISGSNFPTQQVISTCFASGTSLPLLVIILFVAASSGRATCLRPQELRPERLGLTIVSLPFLDGDLCGLMPSNAPETPTTPPPRTNQPRNQPRNNKKGNHNNQPRDGLAERALACSIERLAYVQHHIQQKQAKQSRNGNQIQKQQSKQGPSRKELHALAQAEQLAKEKAAAAAERERRYSRDHDRISTTETSRSESKDAPPTEEEAPPKVPKIRRSKVPSSIELAALTQEEKDQLLQEFLSNSYEVIDANVVHRSSIRDGARKYDLDPDTVTFAITLVNDPLFKKWKPAAFKQVITACRSHKLPNYVESQRIVRAIEAREAANLPPVLSSPLSSKATSRAPSVHAESPPHTPVVSSPRLQYRQPPTDPAFDLDRSSSPPPSRPALPGLAEHLDSDSDHTNLADTAIDTELSLLLDDLDSFVASPAERPLQPRYQVPRTTSSTSVLQSLLLNAANSSFVTQRDELSSSPPPRGYDTGNPALPSPQLADKSAPSSTSLFPTAGNPSDRTSTFFSHFSSNPTTSTNPFVSRPQPSVVDESFDQSNLPLPAPTSTQTSTMTTLTAAQRLEVEELFNSLRRKESTSTDQLAYWQREALKPEQFGVFFPGYQPSFRQVGVQSTEAVITTKDGTFMQDVEPLIDRIPRLIEICGSAAMAAKILKTSFVLDEAKRKELRDDTADCAKWITALRARFGVKATTAENLLNQATFSATDICRGLSLQAWFTKRIRRATQMGIVKAYDKLQVAWSGLSPELKVSMAAPAADESLDAFLERLLQMEDTWRQAATPVRSSNPYNQTPPVPGLAYGQRPYAVPPNTQIGRNPFFSPFTAQQQQSMGRYPRPPFASTNFRMGSGNGRGFIPRGYGYGQNFARGYGQDFGRFQHPMSRNPMGRGYGTDCFLTDPANQSQKPATTTPDSTALVPYQRNNSTTSTTTIPSHPTTNRNFTNAFRAAGRGNFQPAWQFAQRNAYPTNSYQGEADFQSTYPAADGYEATYQQAHLGDFDYDGSDPTMDPEAYFGYDQPSDQFYPSDPFDAFLGEDPYIDGPYTTSSYPSYPFDY